MMHGQNFCHFEPYPPNNSKNQAFEKMKKFSGNFIILHMCAIMCTINDYHMMYNSWDMERSGQILSHFVPLFALLPPPPPPWLPRKSKFWTCYISVPKIMIICYPVAEIPRLTDVVFIFHFGIIFALLLPQQPRKYFFYVYLKQFKRKSFFLFNFDIWAYLFIPKV